MINISQRTDSIFEEPLHEGREEEKAGKGSWENEGSILISCKPETKKITIMQLDTKKKKSITTKYYFPRALS